MSQENVEAIRAVLKAPFPVFLSAFHEDAVFHAPDWGLDTGVYRGPTAIAKWLRQWMDTWDEYEIEARDFVDAGHTSSWSRSNGGAAGRPASCWIIATGQ
jgi:SnoaL-like protein